MGFKSEPVYRTLGRISPLLYRRTTDDSIVLAQIPELDVGIRSLAVSPDGNVLAAINDEVRASCLVFAPYARWLRLAASQQGHCYIWERDAKDFRALKQIKAHHPYFGLKCMFSPDSTYVRRQSRHSTHVDGRHQLLTGTTASGNLPQRHQT